VSSLQVIVCSSSFLVTEHCSPDQHFSLSLVTASSCDSRYVCQQAPTCHQSFAPEKSAKQLAYMLQRALHQHIQVVQLWYGLQTLLSPSTVLCTSKHCVYCAAYLVDQTQNHCNRVVQAVGNCILAAML